MKQYWTAIGISAVYPERQLGYSTEKGMFQAERADVVAV